MEPLPDNVPIKGESFFGLCMFWAALCTIVLILRFWSRFTLPTARFYWDDWTALAAWPFVMSDLFIASTSRDYGLGRHVAVVPVPRLRRWLQMLFAMYHVYDLGVALSRISAILFYRRVFGSSSRAFRINFWACLTANIVWIITISFLAIFNCTPVHAFWDRAVPGFIGYSCIKTTDIQLVSGITSVVIDLWILLIPMPFLWNLNMTTHRKLLMITVFAFAYCSVVFTIGRMASVFVTGDTLDLDVTWGIVTTFYWYVCEISVSFISISLPSLLHLIKRAHMFGFSSLFNNTNYSKALPSKRSRRRPQYSSQSDHSQGRDLVQLDSTSMKSQA